MDLEGVVYPYRYALAGTVAPHNSTGEFLATQLFALWRFCFDTDFHDEKAPAMVHCMYGCGAKRGQVALALAASSAPRFAVWVTRLAKIVSGK